MKIKICPKCQIEFEPVIIRNGKRKYTNRTYCFKCSKKTEKGVVCTNKQKKCLKCNKFFPFAISIDGQIRRFQSRKYCLECSPLDGKNNRNLHRTEKVCIKCEKIFPLEEFYKRKNKKTTLKNPHYSYCKKCIMKYNSERAAKNKLQAVIYLGGECQKCGYRKCLAALEFHHRESEKKEHTIAHWKAPFSKMKTELDKCQLLCSNCHREIHSKLIQFTMLDPTYS